MLATTLLALSSAFAFASASPLPGSGASSCPPKNFDALPTLNVTAYLGRWYCQAQAPVLYAPLSENYCVTATYTLKPDGTVDVFNYDNKKAVNGPVNSIHLVGKIPNPSQPSKLKVLFPAFPFFGGDYWVIKTGPINADGQYDWALISGGSPSHTAKNGQCIAPLNAGLWIFSRTPVAGQAFVEARKQDLRDMGLDADALNPIAQEGCLYAEDSP
ncbi:hypothetical protein HK101_001618 [Irineochytrium annulatum]|nr:hypothetical protein HK101_001618 [Irineochytrium annulatum]